MDAAFRVLRTLVFIGATLIISAPALAAAGRGGPDESPAPALTPQDYGSPQPDTGNPPPRAPNSDATRLAPDPAIVGHWRLSLPLPTGTAQLNLIIAANGTYSLTSTNPAIKQHAGHFGTLDRHFWTMLSPTWQDAGTYRLLGPNRLRLVGRLGPGVWTRIAGPAPQASPKSGEYPPAPSEDEGPQQSGAQ